VAGSGKAGAWGGCVPFVGVGAALLGAYRINAALVVFQEEAGFFLGAG